MKNKELILKLDKEKSLEKPEWITLFETADDEDREMARHLAQKIAKEQFGNRIYMRGLIEISNICKNDCLYCGIRKSNCNVSRYRMTKTQIFECCEIGYKSGFRTFVLQGGEDGHFTDDILTEIVSGIKEKFPDCAITLSLGERSRESYEKLFKAGADRYLLRHETATREHYDKLHPENLSLENRMECLKNLKEIGFQTGCGMMIGSPYQTAENLANDMLFLEEFKPHMIGIGPFLPAENTPFEKEKAGSLEETLFVLSLVRIMLPNVLLPATTALGTLSKDGRQRAILSGANVMMPNISPTENRKNYALYNDKIGTGEDAEKSVENVVNSLKEIGYEPTVARGDYKEN
ncbi:MAG: [Clostridia bacterium]|nr:[FeFe] hydrogenase H-cluster radical SAM maturase HydE [Clostridia bacterium]